MCFRLICDSSLEEDHRDENDKLKDFYNKKVGTCTALYIYIWLDFPKGAR